MAYVSGSFDRTRHHPWLAWLLLLMCALAGCAEAINDGGEPAAGGLRVSGVLGGQENEGFARAIDPRQFEFPVDHGPHPSFRSEWWYFTSVLQDSQGREYGAQFTLFRQALSPQPPGQGPWQTGQVYLAHLAVTDVDQQRHHHSQRLSRGHPQLAGAEATPQQPLRLWIDDWLLLGRDQDGQLTLSLTANQVASNGQSQILPFGVSLDMTQQLPVVLQGDQGLSHKGPGQASYYYSMPRLLTTGSLQLGERRLQVSGVTWFDREWSTSVLGEHLRGWDWFALQLNDGRNVMAFRLRRRDGQRDPYDHGMLVSPQGEHRKLSAADFSLQPKRVWRDPQGVAWPVAWQLNLGQEVFQISALVDDQVMSLGLVYWEGIVGVTDQQGQQLGRGYMELTGYE